MSMARLANTDLLHRMPRELSPRCKETILNAITALDGAVSNQSECDRSMTMALLHKLTFTESFPRAHEILKEDRTKEQRNKYKSTVSIERIPSTCEGATT